MPLFFTYSIWEVYLDQTTTLGYQIIVLHNLLIFEKNPSCMPLFHLLQNCKPELYSILCMLLDYWIILITFLLKVVKIILVQYFVSSNFNICLPLLLLVRESESCFWNFSSCMLYSIQPTLLTFEKFLSCTLYSICTIIW